MITEECYANSLKGDSITRQLILNAEYRCELTPWGISRMSRAVISSGKMRQLVNRWIAITWYTLTKRECFFSQRVSVKHYKNSSICFASVFCFTREA